MNGSFFLRLLNSSEVISAKSISSVGGEDERQTRSHCVNEVVAAFSSMDAKLELNEDIRVSASLRRRRPGSTPVVKDADRDAEEEMALARRGPLMLLLIGLLSLL